MSKHHKTNEEFVREAMLQLGCLFGPFVVGFYILVFGYLLFGWRFDW